MRTRINISRRTKLKLLVIFFSCLIALLVCEVFLRAINYRPILMDPTLYVANNNPIVPYKLRANYDGLYAGHSVVTDADGYRVVSPDKKLAEATAKGEPQKVILLLGDSGVFGHGLRNEETMASQLQNLVYSKHLNYRVSNIGVSGYTSWNELGAFEEYLAKHTATDVIAVYVPNDITFENDYFGISRGKIASFSQDEGRFTRLTRFVYSHFYTSYLISDSLKKLMARFRSNGDQAMAGVYDLKQMQPAIDYSMEALGKMRDICQSRKINFSVGIYRDVQHFIQPEQSLEYEKLIKENLDRHNLKSFIIKSHIDNLKMSEAKVLWNDPHPSAKAVRFITDDLFRAIE